jgi:magnesium-transporting ATPase (P-type)
MSGIGLEWLGVLVSIGALAAVVVAEMMFLTRSGWTTGGRAAAFALITDIVWTVFTGFFIMLMMMFGLMMAFGSDGQGGTSPETYFVALLIATIVVPPIFLFLLKRGMLALLKIRFGSSAWVYSILSTLFVIGGVLIVPGLVIAVINSIF